MDLGELSCGVSLALGAGGGGAGVMLSGVSIFILVGLFLGVSVDGVDGRSRAWLLFRLMGLMGGRGLGYLVGRLIFFRECEFSLFLPPPLHWEGFGSKKGL